MGEYIYASFEAGGRIHRNHARELVELGNSAGLSVDGEGGDLTIDDVGRSWADSQVNYGNLDELTDFCGEHEIDYIHYHERGPEWDATTYKSVGDVTLGFIMTQEGPAIPITELVKLDALATGWAKLHEQIKQWKNPLPDVELFGELTEEEDGDAPHPENH